MSSVAESAEGPVVYCEVSVAGCGALFLAPSSAEPVAKEEALPGSEPPESNDNVKGANANELASSLQADFHRLIATLAEQIELQDDPDSKVMATLWNAKAAAERG